jgi:hypothetical protein
MNSTPIKWRTNNTNFYNEAGLARTQSSFDEYEAMGDIDGMKRMQIILDEFATMPEFAHTF